MKILKKIIYIIFVIFIIMFSLTIIAEKLIWKDKDITIFGYKNYIVLSGSMFPTLDIGDVIVVKESKNIKKQDIIAFKVNNTVVTHRVIDIVNEAGEKRYITKGDANSSADSDQIKEEDIVGKYCFKINQVGNIILFLKSKTGFSLLIIIFIVSLFIGNDKPEKEKAE